MKKLDALYDSYLAWRSSETARAIANSYDLSSDTERDALRKSQLFGGETEQPARRERTRERADDARGMKTRAQKAAIACGAEARAEFETQHARRQKIFAGCTDVFGNAEDSRNDARRKVH